MQRIASRTIWRVNLLFLSFLPSFALAENSIPEDYLASKPLVLEIRYCECQATKIGSEPFDLLPKFLNESSLLNVSVSNEEMGFASANELSMGYELKPVAGSPDQFLFEYAGNYTAGNGNSYGNGELLLIKGQWVNIFGSQHESETGPQHSNVAVRLAKPGGF
ncbi:hypothetical protein [Marinobacter sp. F3R08]|uniref:hypothetical protein n=1 Tax=Marinobacter sp. F3R08 TaxID=2841559 RepID=UPI001C0A447D|nr:hypothetical protein [Marinobacter sp. F3R08]MBU2952748.1 hypothetical protein [Marinobacter sp. F3R08]